MLKIIKFLKYPNTICVRLVITYLGMFVW